MSKENSKGINALKKNQLNFVEVIALSVAIIAPTFAMSMNVGLMASTVSYSVSAVFVISTILMGFVAVSFIKFNEYFPSAGSVYTFTERSLGKKAASISGWALLLTYIGFSAGCSSAFGSLFSSFIKELTGISISWIIFALICEVFIWFVSYSDVKLSTNIMLVIEAVSILLVILLSVVILVKVGSTKGLSLVPFKGNGNKFSNYGAGIVYAILCFGGFEGASSLGEESKNPKKSIPLAIASTVVVTGLIFVFVSYAEVIGFGVSPSGIGALTKSPSTIVDLSKNYIGSVFTILITLAISISAFSTALGSMTAGSRLLYSMSKDGNVPQIFSGVHSKHHTPYVALNIILAIIIVPVLALFRHDGVEVFGYIGTIGALALLIAYFITSLGSLIYFGKKKIWTWQLIIPVVALLVLAFTFYSNIYPIPAFPNNIFPYIVLAWIIVGFSITSIYKKRSVLPAASKEKVAN
ncbi:MULTISPECIES: APC family permease [Clostridium]|uniref:Putative amino acid permease YhdG n=1 Tax=Clostridium ragsdalei P11 TaxID=1353534 RepID=A0A1A6AQL2_9CLOT|nr:MULTISPECIES: APC family permease [Clostridium]OBR92328.1 putative amino acid permease YhdG [Clostridium ragsdalei P11]QXE17741.1 amino acid permease [Clostridium sp. 001]